MSSKGAIKKTIEMKSTRQPGEVKKKPSTRTLGESKSTKKTDSTTKSTTSLQPDPKAGGDGKKSTTRETKETTLKNPSKAASLQKKTSLSSSSKEEVALKKAKLEKKISNTSVKVPQEKSHREKTERGYSEKRGLTTIYIPKKDSLTNSIKKLKEEKSTVNTQEKKTKEKPLDGQEPRRRKKESKITKERRRSRTLSPSEVKVLKQVQTEAAEKVDQVTDDNDYEYEDDFEDYESDFQDCSTKSEVSQISEVSEDDDSSHLEPLEMKYEEQKRVILSADSRRAEEERMLDSGHYELAEARKRAARMEMVNQSPPPPLPELRPQNKNYRDDKLSEIKSLPLSNDEGFEDGRSGDFVKSPPISQISFIDFRKSKADKAQKGKKNFSRGEELLRMIKLDQVEWTLFECTPVPYEEFMNNYGKLNTQQIYTQTRDDDLDVEIETEPIIIENKWTQYPITCRRDLKTSEDVKHFKMEQIGVGGDEVVVPPNPTVDTLKLNEFLLRVGGVMLTLLEERRSGGNVPQSKLDNVPFSEGVISLSVESVSFLAGRCIQFIHYSEIFSGILLSIHSSVDEGVETTSKEDFISDCCIGCIWNLREPSSPTKLFFSYSSITVCCFHPSNYNIVFAGHEDGTINLWNLQEPETCHQKVLSKSGGVEWTLRSPTFTSSGCFDAEHHESSIVAIRALAKANKHVEANEFSPIQICSLDENGVLLIWSILRNLGGNTEDLGKSYWGELRLIKSQNIPLKLKKFKMKDTVKFIDMQVDSLDTNSIYVATNTNKLQHVTRYGDKCSPIVYVENDFDCCGVVTVTERCPFEGSYFLVGCDDGTVRLHNKSISRPLLQLKSIDCKSPIKSINWSKSKPFAIFVLDCDSNMYIWDLSKGSILPKEVIPLKQWGKVTTMELSPFKQERDMANQYLALGSDSGVVEIHKLKPEYYSAKKKSLLKELKNFLRYIEVL